MRVIGRSDSGYMYLNRPTKGKTTLGRTGYVPIGFDRLTKLQQ